VADWGWLIVWVAAHGVLLGIVLVRRVLRQMGGF
jgi:hypothetical protein